MTRRELREHSFKVLFRADFYPVEEMDEQIERYFGAPVEDDVTPEGTTILHDSNLSEAEQAVVTEKVKKILEKLPEIDEKINQVAEGWKTRRMGKVELTILRLAVYEMQYDEEIPEKVAINEAVELAKKFGRRVTGIYQRRTGETGSIKKHSADPCIWCGDLLGV